MHTTIKFICLTLLSVNALIAQDIQKEDQPRETKMEAFASKTGTITKFIDYKLPNLKLFLGEAAQTRIRKIIGGDELRYFYLIEKQNKSSNNAASIEYDDLLEAIKALSTLKAEAAKDLSSKPDYVENKFITDDGFQFGYYVTEGKSKWYLKFEQTASDNTFFINDVQVIETSFNEAKRKIEEIKYDTGKKPLIARE